MGARGSRAFETLWNLDMALFLARITGTVYHFELIYGRIYKNASSFPNKVSQHPLAMRMLYEALLKLFQQEFFQKNSRLFRSELQFEMKFQKITNCTGDTLYKIEHTKGRY